VITPSQRSPPALATRASRSGSVPVAFFASIAACSRLDTESSGVRGHWLAAVMACGPGAVLSHASAGALWNSRGSASVYVDVTVPSRAGRVRRKGLRVHRSGRLAAKEVTVHERIPVTTVARTLLDLADVRADAAPSSSAQPRARPSSREATRAALHRDPVAPQRPASPRQHADRGLRSRLRLRRAGFEVVRLTADDLAYEAQIVADVEALLSRSRVSSKPCRRASTSSASAM
jgi:hypothetical protein